MKIAYIAAGAAGMYCGACLHDNTLAAALLRLGEEVVLVPTYTPLRTDEANVSHRRVFFGGLNVYLQQKSWLFRHTPRWFDNLLDSPRLLNLVTRGAGAVDPAKLGDMTVSMLSGEQGKQAKELEKLVDWLLDEVRPDVVHLSNSMLLGMARRIDQRCGPPVACALSGEDIFLGALTPPYAEQAQTLMRERAAEVHAFTALNDYYARHMVEYLDVDATKVRVIPHGLNLDGHAMRTPPPDGTPLVVGYLARVCPDKGLHHLVDACRSLAAARPELDFSLKAAGYLGKADRPYLRKLLKENESGPLAGRFEYVGELDRDAKLRFLRSADVFSTPTVYRESKGLPAIEALANGVPVVLPHHGAFPELVDKTGGGVLFPPGDTSALALQLGRLLGDPALARRMGEIGREAILRDYNDQRMARLTLGLYEELSGAAPARPASRTATGA